MAGRKGGGRLELMLRIALGCDVDSDGMRAVALGIIRIA